MTPALTLQILQESDQCSAVTRADFPTRQNDITCSKDAVYVCGNPGCEAPLCCLHMEECTKCSQKFCEGCFAVHECEDCGFPMGEHSYGCGGLPVCPRQENCRG